MNPKAINTARGPERIIQDAIKDFLAVRGWVVMETHGNMYQCGFPDLYIAHRDFGAKWVEVKNPKAYAFTPAQDEYFHKLASCKVPIWILVAATDNEYRKLFGPPNWYTYLPVNR